MKRQRYIVALYIKKDDTESESVALLVPVLQADFLKQSLPVITGFEIIESRIATKYEDDWFSMETKFKHFSYRNWSMLIIDEWKHTENINWCNLLLQLSGLKTNLEDIIPLKIR